MIINVLKLSAKSTSLIAMSVIDRMIGNRSYEHLEFFLQKIALSNRNSDISIEMNLERLFFFF